MFVVAFAFVCACFCVCVCVFVVLVFVCCAGVRAWPAHVRMQACVCLKSFAQDPDHLHDIVFGCLVWYWVHTVCFRQLSEGLDHSDAFFWNGHGEWRLCLEEVGPQCAAQ